jgi:hypothetical protein
MSILALPALYSPECVEGEFCELRPNGVLRSSPKIFPDLAHLDDTRKAHQCLHWAPSLRRRAPRERRSKRRPGPGRRGEGKLLPGKVQLTKLQSVESNRSTIIGGEGGYFFL